ncbi:lymphocyte function-associated antigen 3 isoform X2 [Prinia subflava]|uniref:lymphocyte function-associated antigen 3 isoform X2 n=1 Tax=Prinia subflava TaxID=208062 RepID=UPI002FE0714C
MSRRQKGMQPGGGTGRGGTGRRCRCGGFGSVRFPVRAVIAGADMWLLAPLVCLTTLLAHIYCMDIVGIMGENFSFPVQIDQKMVEPVWRKDKHKVAEWEGQNNPKYFGLLRNRGVLMENGSLTIVNLEKDDAGTYELQYRHSGQDHYLTLKLVVLDSLPEPKISCNTSDDELVLNCTAHFQESLSYAWKLSNNPWSYPNQELSIPLKNVSTTTNATCIIKFSQTQRSSEISLIQCLPEERGDSSSKRSRGALYFVLAAAVILVVILVILHKKGIIKLRPGRTAQNNSAVNGSGEHEQLFPGNSQQQPKPEGDRELNEDDSALKDKQIVKNGVNQEEVTQDAEGGNGEDLNNSSSCSKEDPKA